MSWDKLPPQKHELEIAAPTGGGWDSEPPPKEMLGQKQASDNDSSAIEAAVEGFGQGATFGYLPQINAAVEKYITDPLAEKILGVPQTDESYVERRDRQIARQNKLREENPYLMGGAEVAGSLVTGIASGGLGTGAKAVQGAGKLSAAANAAKVGAKGGAIYGAIANPGDVEGEVSPLQLEERAINSAKGAALGGALGYGGSKLVEGGSKLVANVGEKSDEVVQKIANYLADSGKQKATADEIVKAGKKLGIKVTPGMLDDSGFIERLEDSLSKSPSIFGRSVAKSQRAVTDKLNQVAKEATDEATALSPFQVGEQFKSGLTSKVGERLDPIVSTFDDVAESTKHIPISDKSKEAVARNIQKIPGFELLGGSKSANKYIEAIKRAKSADDLKTLGSLIDDELQTAAGPDKQFLLGIKDKVRNLEKNTVMRGAVQTAREGGMRSSTGEKIGSEIVGELKEARKGYRNLSQDLSEVAETARIRSQKGPNAFLDSVENIPSERIQDKFLNVGNNRQMIALKEKFPEQFELLRQGKLKEIADAAQGKNGIESAKFLRQIENLNPEAKQMIFGSKLESIKDADVIQKAMPRNFNPSGTASAMGFREAVYTNIKDIPNYLQYKAASSNAARKVGQKASEIAKAPKADFSNVRKLDQAFSKVADRANMPGQVIGQKAMPDLKRVADQEDENAPPVPKSGPEKWASSGAEKLFAHDSEGVISPEVIEKLRKTNKGKELLFRASDLKPGSKAMQNLYVQIRNEYLK